MATELITHTYEAQIAPCDWCRMPAQFVLRAVDVQSKTMYDYLKFTPQRSHRIADTYIIIWVKLGAISKYGSNGSDIEVLVKWERYQSMGQMGAILKYGSNGSDIEVWVKW